MRLAAQQDRLLDGKRKSESTVFSLDAAEILVQQVKRELAAGTSSLDSFSFLLILVALMRHRLPAAQIHCHSFHVELLTQATHGEDVRIDIELKKKEMGKGWKISARFLNREGEYLAAAEILASGS